MVVYGQSACCPLTASHSDYCAGAGGGAAGAPAASPWAPFTKSFNSLLGLKNGIFLAGTSTRSPGLGLLPTRGLGWRVRNRADTRIPLESPARMERRLVSEIVLPTY